MKEEKLTDKDLHCIARMLQSAWDAPDEEEFGENGITTSRCVYGCMFCKYGMECAEEFRNGNGNNVHFKKIFRKLQEKTGVVVHSYREQPVGRTFLPASAYLEHPEMIDWLNEGHPAKYHDFDKYLDELISGQSSSGADL